MPTTSARTIATGQAGSVSEVFYPRPDAVQSVGLEFLIANRAGGRVEVERDVALQPD